MNVTHCTREKPYIISSGTFFQGGRGGGSGWQLGVAESTGHAYRFSFFFLTAVAVGEWRIFIAFLARKTLLVITMRYLPKAFACISAIIFKLYQFFFFFSGVGGVSERAVASHLIHSPDSAPAWIIFSKLTHGFTRPSTFHSYFVVCSSQTPFHCRQQTQD